MRLRHDLMGCSNRLKQTASDFETMLTDIREVWKDSRAERFEREDMRDIDTTVDGLVATIQEVCETLHGIDRELKDEEVE
jgi:uncharacterized protein YukE